MATNDLNLPVERRAKLGTTGAHALRAAGKIPAVVYGHGAQPDHVAVDAHAFDELLHRCGRNAIVTLVEGSKRQTALVRVVQRHPVSRRVVHADFQRVFADETISASSRSSRSASPRASSRPGVMDVVTHHIEIEGPADRIPERVEVDVTALGVHEHVTAADVPLPPGFKLITPPDTIVIAIEASRTAQDLEAAAAGPQEAAEPAVVGAETPSEGG